MLRHFSISFPSLLARELDQPRLDVLERDRPVLGDEDIVTAGSIAASALVR
jgi:hypothetical protein